MKIILDVLGGDAAPAAPIEGAIAALKKNADLQLIIVGPKPTIEEALKKAGMGSTIYLQRNGGERIQSLERQAQLTGKVAVKKVSRLSRA